MNTATIKLFLPRGDAKSLRTAEIMNWTGFAIAAPRTELDDLLQREELDKSGIYILSGTDPLSGSPRVYNGLIAWRTKDGTNLKELDEKG